MKINRRLNLAFTVEREDGSMLHAHHVPIPEEVFEANWRLLTKAVNMMYIDVFLPLVASRIGYRMIKKVAEDMKLNEEELDKGFFQHVWRLTTVFLPGTTDPVPLEIAAANKMIDSDELSEVRNCVCFFTSASWVHPRAELKGVYELIEGERKDSGKLTGSWSSTEYGASLKISTPPVSSGATAPAVLVPH